MATAPLLPDTARRRALLAAALAALTGCDAGIKPASVPAPAQERRMVPLRLSILNYSDDYIDQVFVNGSWAGGMTAHQGGGKFAGSAEVPREWDPQYRLTVHWRTEPLYLQDPKALYKREVAAEPYQQYDPGGITMLWIAFFPNGAVKLFPTRVDPSHPDFPQGLLAPSWQCEKEFPGDSKCFGRRPSWETQGHQTAEDAQP